ncbi:MAG TPA: GFA family protein [Polyangiaceae bacterium]|nr:GFA family protein [Polyangiaceae bacterium]
MTNRSLRGRCYCGAVEIALDDALTSAFYCHCSRCRAQTGSAFAAIGCIEVEKFSVRAGEEALLRSEGSEDGHGAVCSRCHARIYAIVRARRFVHIPLGILTDAPSQRPSFHIFVGSKAPWYDINDGLPQHLELPA